MKNIKQILKNRYKTTYLLLFKKLSKILKTRTLKNDIVTFKANSISKSKKAYNFAIKRSFLTFVIIPTAISAFYLVLLQTPRYESTALISLKQNGSTPTVDTSLTSLIGGSSPTSENSYLLINYIQSPQMLMFLQKDLDIKTIFQSNKIDFFSRLSKNANKQDFLDYYRKMIDVIYDEQSGAITIDVQAYSAKDAQDILNQIVDKSQESIDYVSHTLAKNRMKFSREQLDEIKKRALNAQSKLVKFQNQRGIVDPESSITSKSSVIGELKAHLSETETQLTNLKSYMNPEAPEIKALKRQIEAIKVQISREKKEFLSENPNFKESELSDLVSNYQWLKLNAEFAMTEYQTALQSFEMARVEYQSQESYLVDVVKPTFPDTPKYPRVIYNLITIFFILSILYGLGRMILTIIIENR